jgi:hypothetical protein
LSEPSDSDDDHLIAKLGLTAVRDVICAHRAPCRVGVPSDHGRSYLGGAPLVTDDFRWPEHDRRPLEFIGQFACEDLGVAGDGTLLFFRDCLHIGFDAHEAPLAVVVPQPSGTSRTAELPPEAPQGILARTMGIVRGRRRTRRYARQPLEFRSAWSYMDQAIAEVLARHPAREEEWSEFFGEVGHRIQSGGIASPANADDGDVRGTCMRACAALVGLTKPDDWVLLLQLHSLGDMMWGDVGSLCWFVLRDDLARSNYRRAWCVLTCG